MVRTYKKSVAFEWDEQKDLSNQEKHGVSFVVAQRAFLDPQRIVAEDTDHRSEEDRFYCVGCVDNAIITVRFTYRGNVIRIFGAGYWRKGKVTVQGGIDVWFRRRPIHPAKSAFVLGPARQVQQVPSSPALRARSVLRANWPPTCLRPERLQGKKLYEKENKIH
jgi:uncharacterized DUF497 family protein